MTPALKTWVFLQARIDRITMLKKRFQSCRFDKRYHIINYFIRTRGFKTYLEIGTSSGRSIARVKCAKKVGVDPNPRGTGDDWLLQETTSDAFFEGNRDRYDIIFIDGLHLAEQVLRDILNSLKVLNPGGVILLHDCNPLTEEVQRRTPSDTNPAWNGDVWKAIAYTRKRFPELYCRVINRDQGMGIILNKDPDSMPSWDEQIGNEGREYMDSLDWNDLEKARKELLGLIEDRGSLEKDIERYRTS